MKLYKLWLWFSCFVFFQGILIVLSIFIIAVIFDAVNEFPSVTFHNYRLVTHDINHDQYSVQAHGAKLPHLKEGVVPLTFYLCLSEMNPCFHTVQAHRKSTREGLGFAFSKSGSVLSPKPS